MRQLNIFLGLSLLLTAMTLPTFSQVSKNNEDGVYKIDKRFGNDFVPGQVLVKMKDGSPAKIRRVQGQFKSAGLDQLDAVLQEFGVEEMEQVLPNEQPRRKLRRSKAPNGGIIQERDLSQLYRLQMAKPDYLRTKALAERLESVDGVEFAEPNFKAYIMGDVDHGEPIAEHPEQNPSYTLQWNIAAMKVNELWKKPIVNAKRPVIAILDTGVDTTHPDLMNNITNGYDFINNTNEVRDYNSHGTHVAGIAAAADNEIGIIGANPRALIMPVTVMQSDGTGDIATIIRGINYAANNGADIINMSLGTYTNSKALRQALERAYQSCVIVAAAGNDNRRIHDSPVCHNSCRYGVMFPAGYSFVLGVQAITQDGTLTSFSNHDIDGPTFSTESDPYGDEGYNYELKAPGVNILSTIPGGGYRQYNGTSMAAPLVAGAISVLRMVKQFDTQEMLWGDILHSSDFLDAYNLTDHPAELELLGIQLDDRQELVDGENNVYYDGRIDAGETIKLYPVLRTVYGEAQNIRLHLELGEDEDESIVTILQNDVDFGYTLSPFGKNVSENPIIFKTKGNTADGRHIKLKLSATCDNTEKLLEHEFVITIDNMIKIGGVISSDLTLMASKRYMVTSNLSVLEGITLNVEPGTEVIFSEYTSLACFGTLIMKGTPEQPIRLRLDEQATGSFWKGIFIKNKSDIPQEIEYCYFESARIDEEGSTPYMKNCQFKESIYNGQSADFYTGEIIEESNCERSNFINCSYSTAARGPFPKYSNLVNSYAYTQWEKFCQSNYINYTVKTDINHKPLIANGSGFNNNPPYLGTSKESIARSMIGDIYTNYSYVAADLSNILERPVSEAHGIVWKVLVNGKDAQDEFEEMLPLGVGHHKFEVYYNRPMNKAAIPNIAFGLREPYTQNIVNEDGAWNDDGTIYTAYVTITRRTQSDGVNRIYVWGGEDNEYFECPYEKTRFNVNIQAANSMSTGFMAEGGAGCVKLSWDKSGADGIEDAMGYNIYRYTERIRYENVLDEFGNKIWDDEADDWKKQEIIERDTLRINPYVIDVNDENYVDKAVTEGETYYYYYKLQSTDLREYGISNTVSLTFKNNAIEITAKDCNREYGEENPSLGFTTTGAALIGVPDITCEATATSPVGTYPIVITRGSVANENDTYVNGTLTITKAPLTIKAGEYTKKQGEENPAFELTYEGFKNEETAEVLTTQPSIRTTATADSPIGEYEVIVNGAEAQNYAISYVNGKLTITEADGISSMDNGQLKTDNVVIYNLSGQRLSKPQRGVNIVNGKKVIIK